MSKDSNLEGAVSQLAGVAGGDEAKAQATVDEVMTQVAEQGEFTEAQVASALAEEVDKIATEDQNVAIA